MALHGVKARAKKKYKATMDEVIDWKSFDNHRRLHSTLAYVRPTQFEQRWLADQDKRAA